MKNKEIGIVILATNAYFVLGLRFVRRFIHFYKGECNIKFYFFSDKCPIDYLPTCNIQYFQTKHTDWREGTNSKFLNIIKLELFDSDYLYYFDADTNIQKPFTEEWFLGDLVGGEHYSNRTTLKDGVGFDRNPKGNSYVSPESTRPYTYHYGAFFGGTKENVIDFCKTLRVWQMIDQRVGYEPPVNDESYINKYFHFSPPKTVSIEDFAFVVSDKGGLGNTRIMDLEIEPIINLIKNDKEKLWDLQNGKIIFNYD